MEWTLVEMDSIIWLRALLDSSLLSALLGAILGGLLTLAVTIYSLNKQNQNQLNILAEEQKVKDRVTIIALLSEVSNNLKNIEFLVDYMIKREVSDITDVTDENINIGILVKNEKWEKYNDTLLLLDENVYHELMHHYTYIQMIYAVNRLSLSETENLTIQCKDNISKLNGLLDNLTQKVTPESRCYNLKIASLWNRSD